MGRKGVGDAEERAGQWSRNGGLHNIESSVNYTRKTAYDHQWMEKKRNELALASSKKLIPHFNVLLNYRARADDYSERAQVRANSQRWTAQLQVGNGNIDARNTPMKANIELYQALQSEYNDDTVPSLSRLCINTVAENLVRSKRCQLCTQLRRPPLHTAIIAVIVIARHSA